MKSETRQELEGRLGLCAKEEGKPDDLGRRKVRYLVFHREPLVVSYDLADQIENIVLEHE